MKISEEELSQRKARIIHKAFILFCRNGIDKITIKDIAKAAGVGEKSVYRYFSTKKNLLMETGFMLWREIVNELSVTMGAEYKAKTGYEQIVDLLEGFRNLFENHAEYVLFSYDFKLFLIRHTAYLTETEYEDILKPIHTLYLDALRKGLKDGSIVSGQTAENLYYAMWGLMRGFVVKIVIYDRMYDGKNPWKDRFGVARELILKGLRNGCP